MLLKFSQIPRKNTCAGDTFLKSCNPQHPIKKRLQHRCFPVKFAKNLRTPYFTEQLQWLLLTRIFKGFRNENRCYRCLNLETDEATSKIIDDGAPEVRSRLAEIEPGKRKSKPTERSDRSTRHLNEKKEEGNCT